MPANTGYTFNIQNSDGTSSSTRVDFGDMFVSKDLWYNAGLWTFGGTGGPAGNPGMGLNVVGVKYSSPVQVGALTNWKYVACGTSSFTIATKTDGSLWAWGDNNRGQLGNDPQTTTYSSPIQVGALTNWKQVAAGYSHSLYVKTDGTLWACGYNYSYGSLGIGSTTALSYGYSSPVQVGLLTNWKQVAAAGNFSAAVKTDGTLWTWGGGQTLFNQGMLGNGTFNTSYLSPVQIGSGTSWKQISCGYTHMASLKTDGTLWSWGKNHRGQLGNGTTVYYSSPIQIGSLTNWKQVSCGQYHTTAIKTDGTLWACGYNNTGNLGNNTVVNYSSPIQIGSLTNWKTAGGIYQSTYAIKTDGTLWACGYNSSGNLGNGTRTDYSSPIQVGLLTNWKSLSLAPYSYHAMAIQAPDL